MAKLRGSKNNTIDSIIKTLELVLTFPDLEMTQSGIRGVISALKNIKER